MRTIKDNRLTNFLLKKLYIKHVKIAKSSESLSEILDQHPKLIIAVNHGPMMGALAALIGLADAMQQAGADQRAPFGITWRTFYDIPVAKQVLGFVTQVDHGVGFEEASRLLQEDGFTDCVIMPEGELCNFGNGLTVLPFLSPRFIELALVNEVPVLIAVHQGSERWAWPVKLSARLTPLFRWLPEHMKDSLDYSRTISIPKFLKRRLNTLQMSFSLYQPTLSLKSLSQDPNERHAQLTKEAEVVRQKMKKMITQLITERRLTSLVNA